MQSNRQKSFSSFFYLFFCALAAVAQTPSLVKDLNNALVSGNPRLMANMNGVIFFSADDGVHGRELWKTTGTEASTQMVMDIHPTGSSNPANFCLLNGVVFFTATSPFFGTELWKTDGTAAGTVLVKDLVAGAGSSEPAQLSAFGGKIYFSALRMTQQPAGLVVENKLFRSDGTAAGTGVFEPANAALLAPSNFTTVGNNLFFSALSGTMGNELWKTNGTAAGTQVVSNTLTPAQNVGSTPRNLINVGGNLFLSLNTGTHGRQIWKFTSANNTLTRLTKMQIMGVLGAEVSEIANLSGTLFFATATGISITGQQLRKLNSLAVDGTFIFPNATNVSNLTVSANALFFARSPNLVDAPVLASVGAASQTISVVRTFSLIANGDYPVPQNLINADGILFFTAARAAEGRELWKATTAGATLVQNFMAGTNGSDISDICALGGKVLFAANGLGSTIGGNELRLSDGTINGIVTVRNIGRAGSFPREFVKMGNFTYFSADDSDAGRELWKTDGTAAGTQRVADIIAGATGSNPAALTVIVNTAGIQTLFFVAKDPTKGRELFKLENTANALPVRISDIMANAADAGISNLTNVNGTLHFTASQGLLNLGDRIFRVNVARTAVEITGGGMTFVNNLVAIGSTLFFTQSPQVGSRRLDKLVNGTLVPVRTFALVAGQEDPIPQQMTVVGARLFFTAADGPLTRRVWVTNTAATNASPVANFNAANLTNFNGRLVFTSNSANIAGQQSIFRMNTALTGADNLFSGSGIHRVRAAGTNLFFFQTFQGGTIQLSKITTTNNSEVPLGTFSDGNGVNPFPLEALIAGNNLFFTMNDAATGIELWKSAGQANDAALVGDIRPGVGNSNPQALGLCGSDLFFSANNLTAGQEPWKLTNATALADAAEERSSMDSESEETLSAPTRVVVDIKVYPNPATNYVQVDLPESGETGTLSIVSASGQQLRFIETSEGETNIRLEIEDLPKGMYLVRWEQKGEPVVMKKLMVQ